MHDNLPNPAQAEPVSACDNPGLTVLYDGSCPLCQREIAHVKGLAQNKGNTGLQFVDISDKHTTPQFDETQRNQLLARFHVERSDGTRLDGAAAFVAMWERLPGWRWLAILSRFPGVLHVMEWSYTRFLRVRPWLQTRFRNKVRAR